MIDRKYRQKDLFKEIMQMGITSSVDKCCAAVVRAIGSMAITRGEWKNIKKKKSLYSKITLTEEQAAEIKTYYCKHYGKNIKTYWHRLYQSYTGTYCVDYFPEILFSTKLEKKLNDTRRAAFLDDKNLLYRIFANIDEVYIPKTYASCVYGVVEDGEGKITSLGQIVEQLRDLGVCVVKKTTGTSSGRDVMLCNFSGGIDSKTGETVEQILRAFGKNFVVQERVQQSDLLAALNKTSVNTFRVMTYICDDQVKLCPIALRLGRANADRDNIHYGGICVGVRLDGTLRDRAFSEYGEEFTAHPDSGIVFDGYRIPEVEALGTAAKQMHMRMPYLRIISWDLTINKEGKVTLIEMNTIGQSAWFPQMVNGEPLFGEDTPKMLKLIGKKK